ncbi:MAG: tagatose 1,6-diphosphate aldolase [bacterium]|nr:tagatose 1,6-diphosphate aldolase [bacterium]
MKIRTTSAVKKERLQNLLNDKSVVSAMAIDQRGSLAKMLGAALGHDASKEEVEAFKKVCVEVLTPYASAVLLDSEYGMPALAAKASSTGVLLAYEKTGYDATVKGRLPDLLDGYSAAKLREEGADAVKLLVYYDPFDTDEVNTIKKDFIRAVGDECAIEEMPYFMEIVSYSDTVGDAKSIEFAKAKPGIVKAYMEEFSKAEYNIDVLKVEMPFNALFVEGIGAGPEFAYTRDEAMELTRDAASVCDIPFIYLSAGVTIDQFLSSLDLVAEAGVEYSGVLCGRATWQNSVMAYGEGGEEGLRTWLLDEGVRNIKAVNERLEKGASGLEL